MLLKALLFVEFGVTLYFSFPGMKLFVFRVRGGGLLPYWLCTIYESGLLVPFTELLSDLCLFDAPFLSPPIFEGSL